MPLINNHKNNDIDTDCTKRLCGPNIFYPSFEPLTLSLPWGTLSKKIRGVRSDLEVNFWMPHQYLKSSSTSLLPPEFHYPFVFFTTPQAPSLKFAVCPLFTGLTFPMSPNPTMSVQLRLETVECILPTARVRLKGHHNASTFHDNLSSHLCACGIFLHVQL